MRQAAGFQALRIEEALQRVHLDHGVADGRAGGEGDALARVLLVQVLRFHVQVEGAFAAPGLDAGHPFHLGGGLQVLEIMRLVNKEMVHAELVEDQAVVFFSSASRAFRRSSRRAFCFSSVLDDVAVRAGRLGGSAVTQELVVGGDLLPQKRS